MSGALATTVVGSYPQPDWLIDRERLGDRLPPRVRALELWSVSEPFLEEAQDDATRLAVQDMERAGVETVTDGEMRRESYSNRFATALDGVDLDNPGLALDRTGHENPVPRVVGPIRRTRAVEVRDVEFLRGITERRIKITVPGPFTMTQQAQDDHYGDERSLALAYAEAVNEELHDLKAAGADVVQIDEPYLQARPEPARAYAIEAINRALQGIEGETVLHTCFGYAHIVKDRLSGYPFLSELNDCAAATLCLEAAQPDLDPEVLGAREGQVDHPRSDRPRLPRGGDAGARRRPHSPSADSRAAGAALRRSRLRDEVPAAPTGVREASGDGRRRAHGEGRARPLMRKLQSQGVHHITIVGANRQTSIDFWEGVLGMPFVFEQPNLDNKSESHLYFDPGDGRLITVFTNEEREPDPTRTSTDIGCVHHIAFAVSQATFKQVVERLDERDIRHSGPKDRGFMDSIYFEDPLGLLVELASYRFEPPVGFTHAEVLLESHKLRVERGDYNIDQEHLADAIETLVKRSRASLSEDRSPKHPYT